MRKVNWEIIDQRAQDRRPVLSRQRSKGFDMCADEIGLKLEAEVGRNGCIRITEHEVGPPNRETIELPAPVRAPSG